MQQTNLNTTNKERREKMKSAFHFLFEGSGETLSPLQHLLRLELPMLFEKNRLP